MMEIKTLVSNFFASNSYIITENDSAIIIDPSCEIKVAKKYLGDKKVEAILLTHAHADHFVYLQEYLDEYHCPIYCHQKAIEKIEDPLKNYSHFGGKSLVLHLPKSSYIFVSDEQTLHIGNFSIKVIETPGHSDCSVCYLINEAMFSGDTLFKLSIGRTDFYSSNSRAMMMTLKKIYNIEMDYFIYPGHDESTMLSYEKIHNRYLRKAKP